MSGFGIKIDEVVEFEYNIELKLYLIISVKVNRYVTIEKNSDIQKFVPIISIVFLDGGSLEIEFVFVSEMSI